jgi:hypothetical protein
MINVCKNYLSFHRIQENIKIEDGYNTMIKVKKFISEVESMQEKSEYGLSLGEEEDLQERAYLEIYQGYLERNLSRFSAVGLYVSFLLGVSVFVN